MSIRLLYSGVDVAPLLWALQANPQVWNMNRARTVDETSPHREVDDIWIRYAAGGDLVNEPHDSVWYPAANVLPVREAVFPLMAAVSGERLGGILITRIRAGKQCFPHADNGWHAQYYRKFALQVQSAPGQYFCFENDRLETKPGDVYEFDNSQLHWVTNPTEYDRITMIACIRTMGVK